MTARRLDVRSVTPRQLWIAAGVASLTALGVLVQFSGLTGRPEGFYLDESSFAYNAWTIAQRGADEHGQPWPIFFRAFGDWKTAPYIYALAAVFAMTGPSIEAARALSAAAGVVAVALLAWLGYRTTRRPEIAALTGLTGLMTPWLFEPTRLAFEVAFMPALIAAFLVTLHARPPTVPFRWTSGFILALLLAAITYTYTLGRLLGPLLALGLLVYAGPQRWRAVVSTWLTYAVLLIPLLVFAAANPEAVAVRLLEAGYLESPLPDVVARFARQLLGNVDPARLLLIGDAHERHHVPGVMGSLLAATLLLAILGIDRIVHRGLREGWPRYLVYGLVVSLIPASLTTDPFHVHRLIAVPVFLIALTIPAQRWLLANGRRLQVRRAAWGVLAAATLVQGIWFQVRYDEVAPARERWFDKPYPELLDQALATGADPVYLADGIVPGYIHGLWYGAVRGIPADRFVHLRGGERAPAGSVVISSEESCPAPCTEIAVGGFFRLYRVP